jgi:hypothetical protein
MATSRINEKSRASALPLHADSNRDMCVARWHSALRSPPLAARALLGGAPRRVLALLRAVRAVRARVGAAPLRRTEEKAMTTFRTYRPYACVAWFSIPAVLVRACGGRDLVGGRGLVDDAGGQPAGGNGGATNAASAGPMLGSGAPGAGVISGSPGVSSPTVTEPPSDAGIPEPGSARRSPRSSLLRPRSSWTTCSISRPTDRA